MAAPPQLEGVVRVLIADDHELYARSLMTVLCKDERVDVVGIAENGARAVELVGELEPDVVLMDIRMPVMDGLEATLRIRDLHPSVQILLLTGTDSPVESDVAASDATAFLRKESGVQELRQVFFEVASLAAVAAPTRSS
jgi:two-component system, NarL family, vancomycin resistance associated response regulator VraR